MSFYDLPWYYASTAGIGITVLIGLALAAVVYVLKALDNAHTAMSETRRNDKRIKALSRRVEALERERDQ